MNQLCIIIIKKYDELFKTQKNNNKNITVCIHHIHRNIYIYIYIYILSIYNILYIYIFNITIYNHMCVCYNVMYENIKVYLTTFN